VPDCHSFFTQYSTSGCLSRALQQIDETTLLVWEVASVTTCSPGAVAQSEYLARQVLDPAFFDASTGEIKPTLFDDASSRGASVNRCSYATDLELHARGVSRAEEAAAHSTTPKTYIGFVRLRTSDVRAVFFEGRRAFAVYDTASPSDPSHADVCQLISGKRAGRSVRSRLFQLSKGLLCRPTA
jgi:hypothetical protein